LCITRIRKQQVKLRLTIIFLLIVLMPLVFVGWLGIRVAANERVVVEQRFSELMQDRLRYVDARIATVISQRERELLALPPLSGENREQLRTLARDSAIVNQFFVMNENDELHYPASTALVLEYVARKNNPEPEPVSQSTPQSALIPEALDATALILTTDEAAFLDRTHAIWINKRIPAASAQEKAQYSIVAKSKGNSPRAFEKGWYAWYWDNGLNLIFWWRDDSGVIVGAELNPVRLMADIIGALPDTGTDDTLQKDECIALLDSKGDALYTWGMYQPAANSNPTAILSLTAPLSAWRLECYTASTLSGAVPGQGIIFNLVAGLAVLFIAVTVLAVYYYRESSREMREATQRVSFVNQVSHELKTPLTSIRMYAEMLEEELDEADEKARNHVGVIVSESQRLSRLIGNVLTFGRKQRSALKLRCVNGDIDATIRNVAQRFEPALHEKGIEVVFDAGIGTQAHFDPDVLEQVLGNLLSNIEKYAVGGNHAHITSQHGR
jgi:signal transduction histidine kinase